MSNNYYEDDNVRLVPYEPGKLNGVKNTMDFLKKRFDVPSAYADKSDEGSYALSSSLGFAIGDALGVPVEFDSRDKLMKNPVKDMIGYGTHNVEKGTWSDDTSMLLATMDSINEKNMINCDDIMDKFRLWYRRAKYTADILVFDIGNTTRKAIERFESGIPALKCGGSDVRDNGNGSLMRMLPIALYLHDNNIDEEKRVEIINNVSSLTHSHNISKLGCKIYCDYIEGLLNGLDKVTAYKRLKDIDYSKHYDSETISNYLSIINGELLDYSKDKIISSGYVVNTLQSSLWCILHSNDYKSAVLEAVNLGNDTDTVGAITGSMAGIIYGSKSIPQEWKDNLINKRLLENIVSEYEKKNIGKIKTKSEDTYNMIRNQIKFRFLNFSPDLMESLSYNQRLDIEKRLLSEILSYNNTAYKYIRYLKHVNISKINSEYLFGLSSNFQAEVIKNLYFLYEADAKAIILNNIIIKARNNFDFFNILVQIYLETNNDELKSTINSIYQMHPDEEKYYNLCKNILSLNDIPKEL